MLLSILIPTFNRAHDLDKNLQLLIKFIKVNKISNEVEIIISDNSSSDNTVELVKSIQEQNPDIKIILNVQSSNIGLQRNALSVLESSNAEFIMYLGDDDYIAENYLIESLAMIKTSKSLYGIVPSYQNMLPSGEKLNRGRDLNKQSKYYKKGFKNCLVNSWRGHQLSGIILRRDGLLEHYRKDGVNNIYLFIYLVAISALKGDVYHLTKYPVLVTRPGQSNKDWGYGEDGLISEIFDNYKKISGISLVQRSLLELRLLDMQYWRYAMYLKLGIGKFFNAIYKIITGKNTSSITKIVFPVLIPFIFLKHVLVLLANGNLASTLRTKVEVG